MVASAYKVLIASMMSKTETSGDDAAEEWSTPVNWEEDPAIKAERKRRIGVQGFFLILRYPTDYVTSY